MRVLGIDPGTIVTGLGVIEEVDSTLRCVYAGKIRTSSDAKLSLRLNRIYDGIQEVLTAYRPDEVAIEDLFFAKDAKAALKLGHARGVALLATERNSIPIAEYTPTQVKKAVLGYGLGTKDQVQHMVKLLLGMHNEKFTLDISDALAVAICHIHSRSLLSKLCEV